MPSLSTLRAVALGPAIYWTASLAARVYKFGAASVGARAILETTATALLLCALVCVVWLIFRSRSRTAGAVAAVLSAGALGVNLLAMQLTGVVGMAPTIRLVPLAPDMMFVQSTISDGAVAQSFTKALVLWLGAAVVCGLLTPWRTQAPALKWRVAAALSVAAGLMVAGAAALEPDQRGRDRDGWIALGTSLTGGIHASSPERSPIEDFHALATDDSVVRTPAPLTPTSIDHPHVVLIIWETGVVTKLGWDNMAPGLPNTSALLRQCCFVGGQHFSTAPQSTKSNFSLVTGLYPQPSNRIETRRNPSAPWPSLPRKLADAGFDTAMLTSFSGGIDRLDEFYVSAGFQTVADRHSLELPDVGGLPFGCDRELMQKGAEWLREREGKSAFLVLSPSNSHHPYWHPEHVTEPPGETPSARYLRAMRWQDQLLGEFVAALKNARTWDSTILLLTADHGDYFSLVSGESAGRLAPWHVPLAVRHPLIPATDEVSSLPTSHVDVAPTVLDLCGIEWDPREFQGVSWCRPVRGRWVFMTESFSANRVLATDGHVLAIYDTGRDRCEPAALEQRMRQYFAHQYWRIEDLLATAAP